MNRESRITRNLEIAARQLAEAEGGVLLDLESGAYHRLNQVGFSIWELIDGERTVGELIEEVRERTENPPPQVDQDVMAFLEAAHARDLIRVAE